MSACRYEEREVNGMEKERSTERYAVDGRGRESEVVLGERRHRG